VKNSWGMKGKLFPKRFYGNWIRHSQFGQYCSSASYSESISTLLISSEQFIQTFVEWSRCLHINYISQKIIVTF
jgi:hypothetical protein